MDRNIQFEVQFLLSTIIVVLGIIGVTDSERYVHSDVGVIFVIITTSHLLLLITYYAFSQLSGARSPHLNKLKTWSENTLFIVSISFIYFVFHIIVSTSPECLGNIILNHSSHPWVETVVNYLNLLLPIIPTLMVGGAFWTIGLPTFRLARNLSINILPEQSKIYSDYSGQRTPLMFEVRNEGAEEYEVDVSMELPEGVVAKDIRSGDEFVESEFSRTVKIDNNSRTDLQFEFRHDRDRRETASVEFAVSHSKGVLNESTTLHLR